MTCESTSGLALGGLRAHDQGSSPRKEAVRYVVEDRAPA
jgi:hypothetical protein